MQGLTYKPDSIDTRPNIQTSLNSGLRNCGKVSTRNIFACLYFNGYASVVEVRRGGSEAWWNDVLLINGTLSS